MAFDHVHNISVSFVNPRYLGGLFVPDKKVSVVRARDNPFIMRAEEVDCKMLLQGCNPSSMEAYHPSPSLDSGLREIVFSERQPERHCTSLTLLYRKKYPIQLPELPTLNPIQNEAPRLQSLRHGLCESLMKAWGFYAKRPTMKSW